ncbi:TPA: O-antigen ligase family protein [Enterococcus faecalis]
MTTFACLVFYIINFIHPVLKTEGMRYGFETYSFGFTHPAQFAVVIICLTSIVLLLSIVENKRVPYVYIFLNYFLIIIGGRSTSIGFFSCIILFAIIYPYKEKISIKFVGVAGLLFYFLTKDRAINQIFSDQTGEARGILLRTGFQIAKDQFPLGSGLGMFGSHTSRMKYSPYYSIYGLDSIWGLTPENPKFVADSYWAMIIGELGFIGSILVCIIFVLMFVSIWDELGETIFSKTKIVILLPIIYALITSLVDTALVSKSVIIVMFSVVYMKKIFEEKKIYREHSLIGE